MANRLEIQSGTWIELFDRPISFQRVFVRVTGSVTGALLLSQSVYWQKRCTDESGWFWKTQEEWEDETGLTRRELEVARRDCVHAGVLKYERRGMPAKSFYRVDFDALGEAVQEAVYRAELLAQMKGKKTPETAEPQSRMAESAKQCEPEAPIQIGGKRQSTNPEMTPEMTPENREHPPKPVQQVASPVHEAMALWIQAFGTAYLQPYNNVSAKRRKADESAMRSLVESGRTPEEIGETARAMFALVKKDPNGKSAWWSSRCRTMEHFVNHINEINGEIQMAGVRIGGQETQAEREDREQREFYGSSF